MKIGMLEKFGSIYGSIFISRIIGGLIQLLMFGIIATEIGSLNFGLLSAALVTVQLLGAITEFGFGALVMSRTFFTKNFNLIGTILSTNILISVIEATIGLSFTLLLGTANTYLLAFFPLLLWGAGEKLANLGLSVAISQSDSREVRRNILTRRIFTFACFLLLTSQFPWTLVGFSYFLGASSVIGGIISAFRYRNFLTGIEFTNFRRIMLLGIPFQINSFLNQLRNMDVFILNQFVSSGVAGNYALALRFSQPVSIPLSALSQTGITSISAGIHSATVKFFLRYSSAFRYSFIAIIVVSLIPTSFVSSRFFTDYSGIGTTFKIQMIAFLLFGVIAVETAILQAVGRQNFVYKSAIIGILGNLIIIGLGGYHYGELGASAALLLGNFIQSFLLYRVRRQRIHPGE